MPRIRENMIKEINGQTYGVDITERGENYREVIIYLYKNGTPCQQCPSTFATYDWYAFHQDVRKQKKRLFREDDPPIPSLESHVSTALNTAVCRYEEKRADRDEYQNRIIETLDAVQQVHTEELIK